MITMFHAVIKADTVDVSSISGGVNDFSNGRIEKRERDREKEVQPPREATIVRRQG